MANVYYEKDADRGLIADRKVAVIGYGSQGHAHALNLKDSGVDVRVGLGVGSKSIEKATAAGLRVTTIDEATAEADIIMILIPDTEQKRVYEEDIAPNLKSGDALLFAHGFNIRFGRVVPPEGVDVAMVAPKGPGHLVRRTYEEGGGTPCLIAVQQDASGKAKEIALAYADAIGGARAGVIETTFDEETETDLFGEQVVLCGGLTSLVTAGFETLVDAGYQPEVAVLRVSARAEAHRRPDVRAGDQRHALLDLRHRGVRRPHAGPRVIDDRVRAEMQTILDEIRSGKFADEWVAESEAGRQRFHELEAAGKDHPIEQVGERLRSMMPWIASGKTKVQEASGGQG